jgi:hypothetical protein
MNIFPAFIEPGRSDGDLRRSKELELRTEPWINAEINQKNIDSA